MAPWSDIHLSGQAFAIAKSDQLRSNSMHLTNFHKNPYRSLTPKKKLAPTTQYTAKIPLAHQEQSKNPWQHDAYKLTNRGRQALQRRATKMCI
jgi:hypothetical protein